MDDLAIDDGDDHASRADLDATVIRGPKRSTILLERGYRTIPAPSTRGGDGQMATRPNSIASSRGGMTMPTNPFERGGPRERRRAGTTDRLRPCRQW